MTIGNVKFYKMKGSLSSGEYPLFSTGQDLSTYLIHTASVKFAKGLQTVVKVPSFTGYETVNIAEMDGEFYWVTAWHESSTANMTIEFVLDFMGPTSFFRSTDTAKGSWHKLPSNLCKYLKQEITNGVMGVSRSLSLSALDCPNAEGTAIKSYWVQITGHDTNGKIHRFGLFLPYNTVYDDIYFTQKVSASNSIDYASFNDLCQHIYEITAGAMTAETIDDVSISKRCPYKTSVSDGPTSQYGTIHYIRLLNTYNNTPIDPDVNYSGCGVYDIQDLLSSNYITQMNNTSISVTLSDSEMSLGALNVRDWNRNTIFTIPSNRSASFTISAKVHADMTGIHTIIDVFDNQISIPEGKLPFFGSSYATYRAYSMDSDRQAMEFSIENAKYNRETSINTGIMNTVSGAMQGLAIGALSGNIATAAVGAVGGIAGGAVGLYEGQRAFELELMQAKQQRELTEKRATEQPSASYNVAYGTVYCFLNERSPLTIDVDMPDSIDSSYITDWISQYGYPVEGIITATIGNGYYQGSLISDADTKSGMYWDECNKTFMNGFKFISP